MHRHLGQKRAMHPTKSREVIMSNNIVPFTFELAQSFYESIEKFPVDFEDAIDWLGYSRKNNAKRALVKNFTKDVDYLIVDDIHLLNPEQVVKRPQSGGSQPEVILLMAIATFLNQN